MEEILYSRVRTGVKCVNSLNECLMFIKKTESIITLWENIWFQEDLADKWINGFFLPYCGKCSKIQKLNLGFRNDGIIYNWDINFSHGNSHTVCVNIDLSTTLDQLNKVTNGIRQSVGVLFFFVFILATYKVLPSLNRIKRIYQFQGM